MRAHTYSGQVPSIASHLMSWEHYAAAQVRLHLPDGPLVVVPAALGTTVGEFPDGCDSIAIVTAHNPLGSVVDARSNASAHAELCRRLDSQDHQYLPAEGGDPEWRHVEESVGIVDIDVKEARQFGLEFQQDAIFVWTRDDWRIVGCTTDRESRFGWRVLPAQPVV